MTQDTHLDAKALKELVVRFKELVKEETKREFPDDPFEQLRMAINAVFSSWYGARAVTYRRLIQHSRNLGHGGQRRGHGVRQHGGYQRHRRGIHARSGNRATKLFRRVSDECAGRRRGRRHPHTACRSRELARTCPQAYKDLERPIRGWRSIIATCSTWNSPSRKASCTCCKRGLENAPGLRRSGLPLTW